jgi:hypothetical protein
MTSRLSALPSYPLTALISLAFAAWMIWLSPSVPWIVLCVGGAAGVSTSVLELSLLKRHRDSAASPSTSQPLYDLKTSQGRWRWVAEMLGVMLVVLVSALTVARGSAFLHAVGAGVGVMLLVKSVMLLPERRRQWLACRSSSGSAV